MGGGIDPNATLDYVEFQIFPSQDRYEAFVWRNSKVEKVASGKLELLSLHSPIVKDLFSKGSNSNFKLELPDNLGSAEWFTASTLTRFLRIVAMPYILNITNVIGNEISQLQETRKFQLSLSLKADGDIAASDVSKNELLRAMDLRLTALKEEFADTFNRATDDTCSLKDISYLEKISHLFGAEDIRNSFQKFVELALENQAVGFQRDDEFRLLYNLRNEGIPKPLQADAPVKYGVSPAKVAQVERQSSTESEASSVSSEEDQPSVERSRTLIRSASPRRSASPMRRVQIGRSGSRRAASLSIKSLSYYPARERLVSSREAAGNSSAEEDIEQPPKNNVLRMSVQDKISLFESKQRDQTQTVDVQKTKTLVNSTVGANKAVLRRWSSGMGESSVQGLPDIVSESSIPIPSDDVAPDMKLDSDSNIVESCEIDVKSVSPEKRTPDQINSGADILEIESGENGEVNPASTEWGRRKEAELNQLFMKMMETKPVKQRNVTGSNNSKAKNSPNEQRGGFYYHYKQKRDEKLRGEAAGKRAEKEAQFKVMQQFLDERKAEMASTNVNDIGRRNTVNKPQKTPKNSTLLTNSKKDTSKPSIAKKATSKASPLPATRKSWPSTPSPRTNGVSPAKTASGPTSTGTTPTRRKPQPASSIPRASPNVEKAQPRSKALKTTCDDATKSLKTVDEKKKSTGTKTVKTTKTKVQTPEGDNSSKAKPSFYNKVTKKSSVVPLESKPFLRKGTGIGPGVGSVAKTKVLPQPEESLRIPEDVSQTAEMDLVNNSSDMITDSQERDYEAPEKLADLDSETQVTSSVKLEEESQCSTPVPDSGIDSRVEMSQINSGIEEESMISPTAWVEIEEHQDEIVPCKDSPIQIASPANVAQLRMSSPRVRHSLSQMLLEETSEADILEWGNAENPPAMVYQKDAPKGFKRLLKFARKSKADSHLTGWSSPSAFSEGEDDAEETKVGKRNSDHTMRKAALHASNYGQQKSALHEAYEKNAAQSNVSTFIAQNRQKMQESNTSASGTTTKATRSFFSLSAFRGSKPNETKLPYH